MNERGVTLIELLVAITLLSLLSVGMLFAMRVGLNTMERTNHHVIGNRRVLGVERILTEQIANFVPATALCQIPQAPPVKVTFFQGAVQTMRFVSTWSLNAGARGYPTILEYQVVPGENGLGVRLIVNERLYSGPLSTGALCGGIVPEPATGLTTPLWHPVQQGQLSFVLADKLRHCQFAFKELREGDQPDLWLPRWVKDTTPAAVRIDFEPLELTPGRLYVPSVVAPFRVDRYAHRMYAD